VKKTFELGVQYVTLFLFSTENWSRPEKEVNNIFNLLNTYMSDFSSYLNREKIQLRVIGEKRRLPEYTQHLIETVGYKGWISDYKSDKPQQPEGMYACIIIWTFHA
jgi:undecaprenyl diphosphate synthase